MCSSAAFNSQLLPRVTNPVHGVTSCAHGAAPHSGACTSGDRGTLRWPCVLDPHQSALPPDRGLQEHHQGLHRRDVQHLSHSAGGDAALVLHWRTTCVDLAALLLLGDTALVALCVMYQWIPVN